MYQATATGVPLQPLPASGKDGTDQRSGLGDAPETRAPVKRPVQEGELFKQAIFDSIAGEIAVLNQDGMILDVNESWRRFALENGIEPGQPVHGTGVGCNYFTACRANSAWQTDGALEALEGIRAVLDTRIPSFSMEYPCHSAQQQRWFSMSVTPFGPAPQSGVVIVHTNITERRQAQEKVYVAASVFNHTREGVLITAADGTILDVNDTFTHITGYSRDELIGRSPNIFNFQRQEKPFYAALWRDLIADSHWNGELRNLRKNGEVHANRLSISAVRDAQGHIRQYVALFSDVSVPLVHPHQLEYAAHHDALTGLPNRVLLAERLQQAMAQARNQQVLVVASIDLDGFKAINGRHGHEAGDSLMIAVAGAMQQVLCEGDTLARMGGDAFVAVLPDLAGVAASDAIVARLLAAAAQAVRVGDLTLQVSASIGITFFPQTQDVEAEQLLRQADQAMYHAKLAGKNRCHAFDTEHDLQLRGRHESRARIRLALNENEFVLHYQPKVNMRTGTIIGAEALIRWQHPEKGLLPPSVFLPVIEEHALAVDLGEWVIDAALTQIGVWRAAGLNIPVSVNIGARQLQQAGFVLRLKAILAAHPNFGAHQLEMEVLETSALEDVAGVSRVIEACRELGVGFSLDDFGTGYSSLTYLKRLPVIQIKIDQSFVRDMLDDPDDLAILEGVIGLATAFRREVIAEGVESVEHGEMLLQLGCELAQGYGIARPMPASEVAGWAAAWRPDPAWVDAAVVGRTDFPLLFAGVEHRAWITALTEHVNGERAGAPAHEHRSCRFGAWLNAEGLARHAGLPAFHAIDALHRRMHGLAAELVALQGIGRTVQAQARLRELRGLWAAMAPQVTALVRESASRQ